MSSIKVADTFNRLSRKNAFEGAIGTKGKELFNIVKGKSSNKLGYYAVCSSDNDMGFYPIKLTKWQAEVYGRENFLSTIQLYLSRLFPNEGDYIQVHAKQLIPMSQLNVPEDLKEKAKKQIESLSETYKKTKPNTRRKRIKHLKVHPEDSYLYLVMKAEPESEQEIYGEPLVAKLSFEKALELSLMDDLGVNFLTFSEIKDMFENGKIPRFVSDEEQGLRDCIRDEFLTGKESIELTNHILVTVSTNERGKPIRQRIGDTGFYEYIMQASKGNSPTPDSEMRKVYSVTSPNDIVEGLTQGSLWSCARYAEVLSDLFSYENYKNGYTRIGGIAVGRSGDFEYICTLGRENSLKKYLKVPAGARIIKPSILKNNPERTYQGDSRAAG